MNHIEFEELLNRYLRGDITASEEKLIETWYASIKHTDPDLTQIEREAIKQRVLSGLKAHKAKTKSGPVLIPNFPWTPVFRVAATFGVIAIVFTSLVFIKSFFPIDRPLQISWHIVKNMSERDSVIALSDGTTVSLKKESSFRYPEAFNKEIRTVELINGEAFFNVKRDVKHPFIVLSKNVKTQVLGTSFTVNSNVEGGVVVSVKTGKVLVTTSDAANKKTSVYLTANQKIDYNPKSNQITPSIVAKPTQLVSKEELKDYSFSNSSTADVFRAIEKIYGIEILFDESKLSKCLVTTYLNSGEDLFQRLNIICKAIGATYRIDDLSIIIEGNGC
jgi:ferric-dicitrate binding protein FerR (iron transport regulator)